MEQHKITSPTEPTEQASSVLRLDEEHRQRRESADRRYAEATEAIIAEAFETGDEDLIMLRPGADEEVQKLEEVKERDRSGIEHRVKLRPRMQRLRPYNESTQSTYDNLSVDFSTSSERDRSNSQGHTACGDEYSEFNDVSVATANLSILPSMYSSQVDELTQLVPNIRLRDEDESDLAAREYQHRSHQQPTIPGKAHPTPRNSNETSSGSVTSIRRGARQAKATNMATIDTPPKVQKASGSRKTENLRRLDSG